MTGTLQTLCIYCGSGTGNDPAYAAAARETGALFARRGITLVFGGGSVGLMGVTANAALDEGGKVIGVIPRSLRSEELAHEGVSEMIVVDSMHARKQKMVDLADAFIALPGGIGTLDELFETWTWLQLGIHAKPIGLLNVAGYYDPLIDFLQRMSRQGFLKPADLESLLVDDDMERLLKRLHAFEPPSGGKWVTADSRLEP
ncbi:MAG: TIGR00730 family Rossman fold protein [Burkholderiales bacterium]